jgi:hypothetical protein
MRFRDYGGGDDEGKRGGDVGIDITGLKPLMVD